MWTWNINIHVKIHFLEFSTATVETKRQSEKIWSKRNNWICKKFMSFMFNFIYDLSISLYFCRHYMGNFSSKPSSQARSLHSYIYTGDWFMIYFKATLTLLLIELKINRWICASHKIIEPCWTFQFYNATIWKWKLKTFVRNHLINTTYLPRKKENSYFEWPKISKWIKNRFFGCLGFHLFCQYS